jgi:chromosome partitioning protein
MIITVGNTKGGVGKTTIALNLAIARALQGRDVWLIDGDRQGTAQTAITIRAENGKQPAISCAHYPDGSTLRAQVIQTGPKFQDIIIDAGGRDSTALRAALILSDVLVIPFAPRSLDVWALADIDNLIQEARAVRDGLRVIAMPTHKATTTTTRPPLSPTSRAWNMWRHRSAAASLSPTRQGRACQFWNTAPKIRNPSMK